MLGFINKVIFLIPFLAFGSIQNDTINKINLDEVVVNSGKIVSNKKNEVMYISRANIPYEFKFKVPYFKKHLSINTLS